MKYVRHLNEQWYEELIEDFKRCYEELFYKLRGYNNTIVRHETTIEATPVVGKRNKEFPFPLAEKVYEIYQWLTGNRKNPPEHTEDTLNEIMDIAYYNPFIDFSEVANEIEWERWKGMYTGFFYAVTEIALKLHKKESINASELAMMIHVSQVAVLKQIKNEKFPAIKKGNSWEISGEVAKAYIAEYNEANPCQEDADDSWAIEEDSIADAE